MKADGFLPRLVLVTLAAILVVLVWRGVPLLELALREPAGVTTNAIMGGTWPIVIATIWLAAAMSRKLNAIVRSPSGIIMTP